MYTILMNKDGSLMCTTPTDILYQTESLVDNIHFLIPKIYKDVVLNDFTIYLKYVSPANISKIEILTLKNDDYKQNYLEYVLPITTDLTKMAGSIKMYLTMIKVDTETVNEEDIVTKYVSHSGETQIRIEALSDYFTDENSLFAIDRRLTKMEEIASVYDKTKADNISLADNVLQLTSHGEKIGDGIIFENEAGAKVVMF